MLFDECATWLQIYTGLKNIILCYKAAQRLMEVRYSSLQAKRQRHAVFTLHVNADTDGLTDVHVDGQSKTHSSFGLTDKSVSIRTHVGHTPTFSENSWHCYPFWETCQEKDRTSEMSSFAYTPTTTSTCVLLHTDGTPTHDMNGNSVRGFLKLSRPTHRHTRRRLVQDRLTHQPTDWRIFRSELKFSTTRDLYLFASFPLRDWRYKRDFQRCF